MGAWFHGGMKPLTVTPFQKLSLHLLCASLKANQEVNLQETQAVGQARPSLSEHVFKKMSVNHGHRSLCLIVLDHTRVDLRSLKRMPRSQLQHTNKQIWIEKS